MDRPFIERKLFTKFQEELRETIIKIEKPHLSESGFFESRITFSNVKKYNTLAKCIDEFSTMECALDYVEGICINSEDPEFFINENESMKGFDRSGGETR